uniref:Uncharacterized protein n=1 Tax=Rhipicephalus zambeziensis TaxID=60191 RepID=A0A224Y7R3_9ACAR
MKVFLLAKLMKRWHGSVSQLSKNEAMQRPNCIYAHDLVQPKCCRQHFTRERQRCYFLSLSSSFNFCGSPTDVVDKGVLPLNSESHISLVDVSI